MTGAPEPQPEDQYRLFVALELPEAVRAELERAQQRLRREVSSGLIRWARPDQLHLTLRFLGGVEAGRVPALVQALHQACRPFPALSMRAAGIGFFPNARRPRVIWAGVADMREQLAPLAAAVTQAPLAFSSEPPAARFAAHITLGRVKELSSVDAARLAHAAEREAGRLYGDWVAGEIALVRSRLAATGSIYSRLADVPLTGERA
jgi:2'-5' RNA ligase